MGVAGLIGVEDLSINQYKLSPSEELEIPVTVGIVIIRASNSHASIILNVHSGQVFELYNGNSINYGIGKDSTAYFAFYVPDGAYKLRCKCNYSGDSRTIYWRAIKVL